MPSKTVIYILIKIKSKDRGGLLKTEREKKTHTYKRNSIKISTKLPYGITQVRKKVDSI